MTRRDELHAADVLEVLTNAAQSVVALRVSVHEHAAPPASLIPSDDIERPLAAWSELLADVGAPALPLPRAGTEGEFTLMGSAAEPPQPLGPHSLADLATLAQRQGRALAEWVADGVEEARDRMKRIRDAYRDVVDGMRRAARWVRSRTEEGAGALESYLDAAGEYARGVMTGFQRAIGQGAWGFGFVVALAAVAWAMSKRGR